MASKYRIETDNFEWSGPSEFDSLVDAHNAVARYVYEAREGGHRWHTGTSRFYTELKTGTVLEFENRDQLPVVERVRILLEDE